MSPKPRKESSSFRCGIIVSNRGLFERCREVELAEDSMSPTECQSAARELAARRQASMKALDDLLLPAEQRSVG
jgi:hypothetical protein